MAELKLKLTHINSEFVCIARSISNEKQYINTNIFHVYMEDNK